MTPAGMPEKGYVRPGDAILAVLNYAFGSQAGPFVEVLVQPPPPGERWHNSDTIARALVTALRTRNTPAALELATRIRVGMKNMGTHGVTYVIDL